MRSDNWIYRRLIVIFPVLLLLALSPVIPFIQKLFTPESYFFVRTSFGTVCHQNPAKCPGGTAFLCYRCLGIYSGVWFGLVFGLVGSMSLKRNTWIKLLGFSIVFLVTDVILHNFRVYYYIPLAATATGAFFGFTLQQFITKYN